MRPIATLAVAGLISAAPAQPPAGAPTAPAAEVLHQTVEIDGVSVFYREAGDPGRPTVLLLHGFPTSSHMFRDLIPRLAADFHVVAPDYPGYGASDMPPRSEFAYTFDNLADTVDALLDEIGVDRFSLYVMDYGAPVGFRLAERHPQRVEALIVQNGNAYTEGLEAFWDPIKAYWKTGGAAERDALRRLLTPEATRWQYTAGVRNPAAVSPDTWTIDQAGLDRPGNDEIQLDLFYDYRTNLGRYPAWQAYFRAYQPPTLIVWGKNDPIFPDSGAYPYLRDLEDVEFHLFNTGHFALEEDGVLIADLIRRFLLARL
ncbi:MAG: alpha/beta hydrolase [Planctomycetota bacterium]|nr:MAG: alpha/beta hydrolase [Planctomycetota bacterium]